MRPAPDVVTLERMITRRPLESAVAPRTLTVGPANVAVTARAPIMVTAHVPVPEHPSPLHPVKRDPVAAVAVSVTLDDSGNCAVQVVVQFIPAGAEVTVPAPVPAWADDGPLVAAAVAP